MPCGELETLKIEIVRVYSDSRDEWEMVAEFLLNFLAKLGLTYTGQNNGGL